MLLISGKCYDYSGFSQIPEILNLIQLWGCVDNHIHTSVTVIACKEFQRIAQVLDFSITVRDSELPHNEDKIVSLFRGRLLGPSDSLKVYSDYNLSKYGCITGRSRDAL